MQRRSFLFFVKGLALGVGGATGSRWVVERFGLADEPLGGRCVGEEAPVDPVEVEPAAAEPELFFEEIEGQVVVDEGGAEVDPSASGARLRLILVIPSERDERWRRGRAFGEFLNHGGDEALARLALLEVSCATIAEVKAHTSERIRSEPWMILVDETVTPARVTAIDPPGLQKLASVESHGRAWMEGEGEDGPVKTEQVIDQRIEKIGAALAAAIDAATVTRLAALEAASLSGRLAVEAKAVIRGPLEPRLDVVAAAPATLLASTLAAPRTKGAEAWMERHEAYLTEQRKELFLPRLAELARDRLVRSRPPEGARWANSGGCGVRVEGDTRPVAIGCGMGHVPERSRRFLSFLNDHARGF